MLSRPVSRLAGAVAAGALAVAGVAAVAAPARADGAAALQLTGFRQLVVDGAHSQVFLAGETSGTVEVRGFDGSLKGVVGSQAGAAGLAISADGSTVYAALAGANAVSRIDTATRTETARWTTGACTRSVALSGTKLYVGHGCAAGGALGVLDVTAPTPTLTDVTGTAFFYSAPLLAVGGTSLVACTPGQSPANLVRYDLTATPPVALTSSDTTGSNCEDLAVEGSDVVTADGFPYTHRAFALADLGLVHTYPAVPYPNSVAVAPNGTVTTGVNASADRDVRFYAPHGTTELTTALEVGPTDDLLPRGLAWSPDGSTLFAVGAPLATGSPVTLHVFTNPLAAPVTMTLTGPATATRATAVTLTGALSATPAIGAGRTVTVTKTDLAGTHTLAAVTTTAGGAFTVHDTPAIGGTNTYTVSFAGDGTYKPASASAAVAVSRLTPALTVATDKAAYVYGAKAVVTAHLGTTFNGRTVRLYAKPYGATSSTLLTTGVVDVNGNISTTRVMSIRTTFIAVFPGDYRYAARTVTTVVTSTARVTEALGGYYSSSGAYKLYHATVDPAQAVAVAPNKAGLCVKFVAQAYTSGAWRAWATSPCFTLDASSTAVATLTGSHPKAVPFRLRVLWTGDTGNVATSGAWQYLKFTA